MNLTAQQRNWFYGIATSIIAIAAAYKVVEPEHVPLWLDLAANILGVGVGSTAAVVLKSQRDEGLIE
mgnify:CR=1 FL=1